MIIGSENMSKSEKYGLIGILALLAIVLVISCFVKAKPGTSELSDDGDVVYENAQKESAAVQDSEKGEFVQIDINQYMEKYNGSEKQIVLIARPTCGYCQIAEPIIQSLIYKYNFSNTVSLSNVLSNESMKSSKVLLKLVI